MNSKRLLFAAVLLLASALPLAVVAVPSASADSASKTEYNVSFTMKCNNQSLCDSQDLGGVEGWAAFNYDGSGTAQVTETSGPGGGVQHFESDIVGPDGWFVEPDGDFGINNETVTFRGGGPPVTMFDPYGAPNDLGIPATPGHWNATTLYGLDGLEAPPGEVIEIEVTLHHP